MNLSGYNAFKFASGIAAVGFVWFTFLSPETANAADKADFCLVAFFATLAAYFYGKWNADNGFNETDRFYRQIDNVENTLDTRIENLCRKIDDLEDKVSNCGSACPKRGR